MGLSRPPDIDRLEVAAFRVPTDAPEADGTFSWDNTTIVVVQVHAAGETGLGYSYTDSSVAQLVERTLRSCVVGRGAYDIASCWESMVARVRNLGRPGLCAMGISAVDSALWDLKARLLGVALVDLLGASRASIPLYGSGGFTSYSDERLTRQLQGWVEAGVKFIKMKIGTGIDDDVRRVQAARRAIGERPQLFVDANGAYDVKQALACAERIGEAGVTWFEEPVSSDDLAGLRAVREHAPAGMDIAAGEYGFDEFYFERMLKAEAVDVLQADATRCCGITGFLRASVLASAHARPLSAHCAPALHAHVCCALPDVQHVEYFHDHVRIERMLFDGVLEPRAGLLEPDRSRPGMGLTLRIRDAEPYRV